MRNAAVAVLEREVDDLTGGELHAGGREGNPFRHDRDRIRGHHSTAGERQHEHDEGRNVTE